MAKKDDQPSVRQLDTVIAIFGLVIGLAALAGTISLVTGHGFNLNLQAFSSLGDNLDAFTIIFNVAVYAGIAYGIYYFVVIRPRKKADFDASPEHPFKVDITIRAFQDSFINKMQRGRAATHNLEINVDISPKDWQRIKDAGLYDATLFEYPNQNSVETREMERFKVIDLRTHGAVSFYNINDALEAKEKLIKALHDLKDTIDVHKEGPQREVMEI
jgi:hypothetical protein